MLARIEKLENANSELLRLTRHLITHLCPEQDLEDGQVVRSRSPSPQRDRKRSRSKSPSPPRNNARERRRSLTPRGIIRTTPPPIKRGGKNRDRPDYSVYLESPKMGDITHDQLTNIFSQYAKVVKVFMWRDFKKGNVGRVRFNTRADVELVIEHKEEIAKEHQIMCSEYIRM